jgi:hypothetical protein
VAYLPPIPELVKKATTTTLASRGKARVEAEQIFGLDDVRERADMWIIEPSRWHEIWPYEVVAIGPNSEYTFSLPIPPESVTIAPIVASAVTPTLGGVVEETSANVFWQISLQGSMGLSTSRQTSLAPASGADAFRKTVSSAGFISGAVQGLANTIQTWADTIDTVTNGNALDALNAVAGNKLWFRRSAVMQNRNGFYEILLFHKFLQMYSLAKEKEPQLWSLYFRHHKNNQQWRVVVTDFRVQNSKDSPMGHKYAIAFKGWDLRSPDALDRGAVDRFGKDGDLYVANTLTLTGVLTKARGLVNTIRRGPAGIADALVTSKPVL